MTAFVGIIDRPTTITIDGYSSAKTINGVMHDIARIMKRIGFQKNSGHFRLVVDRVPLAAYWDEEIEKMEKDDKYGFYFRARIAKHSGDSFGKCHLDQ